MLFFAYKIYCESKIPNDDTVKWAIITQGKLILCGGYLAVYIKSLTTILLDQLLSFLETFMVKEFYILMTHKKIIHKDDTRNLNTMVKTNKQKVYFKIQLYENC